MCGLGTKSFRYVSPSLTNKRVCTLFLLVDYCHAFLDGGIVEKEKKKCMSSSSPSHTNTYTSFSYVQRSNIKLLQLCCKICFCIVCACFEVTSVCVCCDMYTFVARLQTFSQLSF
uniref:Uncharacterized protein n=1 Tax=Rhipicephalus zambeziensis TaxID=60191 RepID=A0A224YHU7_9ACAR